MHSYIADRGNYEGFAIRATEKKLFNEVVFSTVSQTKDLQAIQQDFADKIGLKTSLF